MVGMVRRSSCALSAERSISGPPLEIECQGPRKGPFACLAVRGPSHVEWALTYSRAMPRDDSANAETTRAELAALANTLDQCRARLGDLASQRGMAVHDPNQPHAGDDLLTAIYEAERGVNNALRLVQRAARSR